MVGDKHSQDALAKLYAEWVSAGVKLSLAGFTASLKVLEATGQTVTSARAKANEAIRARESTMAAKPEAQGARPVAKPERVSKPVLVAKTEKPTPVSTSVVGAKAEPAANDLKRISGIGPKLEQMLILKGLTTFARIAALSAGDAAKLDEELNLNGRIQRDDWIGQALKLAGA